MSKNELGQLFVISGPSGVGKDTLMALILSKCPSLKRWVTMTSRKPREGEVEGVDYFFKTKNEMKHLIEQGQLVEWNEYADNIYGTPKKFVEKNLQSGNNVVTCIDVNGAFNVQKVFPNAQLIFIKPPSIEELKNRLLSRGTETPEQVEKRLNILESELQCVSKFDYCIINDCLDDAVNELFEIISK